ncbi:MAG TPA: response regulator transcription factor [Capillimicrobium sp.]|nr:response regulator transcription factor [Capillimicrobium sp.]
MRLFLCDDNAAYRELVRLVLERAGHEVVGEAGDGAEAVERAPGCAPEVVLLDLNMPKVGGIEALPQLRGALGPDAKILVLTTGQAPQERRSALDAGADGFIVKPDRVFSLDDELRAALSDPGPAGAG